MRIYNFLIFSLFFLSVAISNAQDIETVVQRGHYAAVKAVAFTPDGKYLLTGSRDKSIKLWDFESGREVRSYLGHKSTVNDIDITSDGKYFVSSSADRTAKYWEISTGKLIRSFDIHKDYVTEVKLSEDDKVLFTGGYDFKAYLWNVATGDTIRSFKVDPDKGLGYGVSAAFHPNGRFLAIGNDNSTTRVIDLKSDKEFYVNKPSSGSCGGCGTSVSYAQKGSYLIMAPNKGRIKVQDIEVEKITEIETYIDEYQMVAMNHQGDAILALGEDSLKLYSWPSAKLIYAIDLGFSAEATGAAFSPDGKNIVVVSDDQSMNIYDAEHGKLIKKMGGYLVTMDKAGLDYDANSRWDYYIKKYTDLKNDFAISPDGKYLAKGKISDIVRLWDIKSGKLIREFHGHEKAVLCMAFTPDGEKLVTGSADKTIRVWDVETGEELNVLKGHWEVVFSLNINKEGTKIISGSWDSNARVWDLNTGELLESYPYDQASPYQIEFYGNDIYAIVAGLDKTLKMYELDSKTEVTNFIGHTDVINAFSVHPDQNTLASVSWDGRLKCWNMFTGLQNWRVQYEEALFAVRFNHQGNILAVGGGNRDIEFRDAKNGNLIKTLKGHQAAVTNLSFTQDDKLLISSSEDGMIKIWNVESASEIITYIILNDKDWMVISPEGFFNGTPDAFDKVAFVKGMKSYSANQFFDQYYQPDLLDKVFSSVKNGNINLNDRLQKSPPPTIQLMTPHAGEVFKTDKASVILKVTDQGGGIDEISLMNNGKAIKIENQERKGNVVIVNQDVNLVPGRNEISAVAFSNGRVQSDREKVAVSMEGKLNSTLYLVSIGINKYKNEDLNLNYAAADAEGFSEIISQKSKSLFDRVEVISLQDENATRSEIMNKLDLLSKVVKPQDVLFFYYAGHGSMVDSDFYFIPSDNVKLYNKDKLSKEAIYAGDIQQKLKSIAALKQVLIIDACQSGGSVEVLASRGAEEEKALAQLSRSTGTHVLASAGSDQSAIEFKELGHGLFTYVLLQALSGEADGAPKDGKITVYELKSYVEDQVAEYSRKYRGKMQFPHSFSHRHDVPIVID